jgi:hypothetical protein
MGGKAGIRVKKQSRCAMPTVYTAILSYKSGPQAIPGATTFERKDYNSVLESMTHIFRLNFWSVFSTISRMTPTKAECQLNGLPGRAVGLYVCHSGIDRLDGVEGSNYIVVARFVLNESVERVEEMRRSAGISSESKELQMRRTIDSCFDSPVMDAFKSDVPGFSAHVFDWPDEASNEDAALVSAFYHFGWTILLRLDRDQSSVVINPNEKEILLSSSDIIKQRVRLINVKRRFLSRDRTNQRSIRKLCIDLAEKYALEERFDGLNKVHELFESHLDNSSKVMQLRKTRAVSNVLNILTFSAIPLGIMGVLLAIDLSASILREPETVIQVRSVYIIAIISFVIPVFLLGLAKAIDSFLLRRMQK